MKRTVTLGCDLGNAETKSKHTQFVSGYTTHGTLPFGADEYLHINGKYFVPSATDNFPYEILKADEKWGMLILLSVSKEILFRIRNNQKFRDASNQIIQDEVSTYKHVNLALGLPPGDMQTYKDSLLDFYKDYFKGSIEYDYCGFKFSFVIDNVDVFPQDIAALLIYKEKGQDTILSRMYDTCYGIDIGGFTADIVRTVNKGKSDLSQSDSLSYGVNVLHNRIAAAMRKKFGVNVEKANITSALLGHDTFFDQDELDTIIEETQAFVLEFMNKLVEMGIDLKHNYIIFLGGGAQLLKPFIEKYPLLNKYSFISNSKINAEGFEAIMISKLKAAKVKK